MKSMMNPKVLILGAAVTLAACSVNPTTSNEAGHEGMRKIGHAVWYKQKEVDIQNFVDSAVPNNMARIIVIRNAEKAPLETSINVGVNDRYLESIQPNHFADTLTCSGVNELSVATTGMKTNNLKTNNAAYQLAAGQTYYFEISANKVGNATLTPISSEQGQEILKGKDRQSHQISRVVPQCQTQHQTTPVLAEMNVFFATNQYQVSPDYYPEIQKVAGFMQQYPNTTILLQGYTDSRSNDAYNDQLSQRRANAVKTVLVNQFNIEKNRIRTSAYGEKSPFGDNETAEGRQLNRRVVAILENTQQ